MTLRALASLVAAAATLIGGLPAGLAQPAPRAYRVGVLANAFDTADGPLFEAFLDELRKQGYVEDQNVVIEWRSSEGDYDRLPGLAADLVRSKVDVVVATSLQPARAAVAATKTIPVVFVVTADPVGHGLVGNLARPGGNVTGVATSVPAEIGLKVIELLKETVPSVSRLAVLANPANPAHGELLARALPAAAQRAKVTLLPLAVTTLGDIPRAFDTAAQERADALYVLSDVVAYIHRARIVGLAARNRIPTIYAFRSAVEAGGLMSYGPSLRDSFRRAAVYVDRILKGAKPGELPVEQPTAFQLVVNLKAARALGLTIPPSLLRRADEVIQ
jgi:putative ABC transport system substrate-binding protein